MTRRVVVISGGVSVPSSTRLLADQLSDAVRTAVTARGEAVEVDVIELRELAVPLAQHLSTGGMPIPALERAWDLVGAADGLVAVTPVFAASYSGLFKMFFDSLAADALRGVPVLIAATAGTPRHSLMLEHALRPLFSYLQAVVVPTAVFAATEDFGGEAGSDLTTRIRRGASELAGLVVSETGAVQGFTPADNSGPQRRRPGLGPVTPFEELLRGHSG